MIRLMEQNELHDVMELWLRTSNYSNSFIEEDFRETHYDYVKEKYIDEKNAYVYITDGTVAGFTVVSESDEIAGLFVDPAYQNKGIGTELIKFLQSEYTMLHTEIYAKNRKALAFSIKLGFIIDGAIRHEKNNEVMYTILWEKN